jgi:predicted nuclease of predicted toxin-antitoxin system
MDASLLIDQNLPRRVVGTFETLGVDAVHVTSVGLAGKPDRDIWRYAAANNRVIVTKDIDFAQITDLTLKGPVRVVRLCIGNTSNKFLFAWLLANWSRAQAKLVEGHVFIELA